MERCDDDGRELSERSPNDDESDRVSKERVSQVDRVSPHVDGVAAPPLERKDRLEVLLRLDRLEFKDFPSMLFASSRFDRGVKSVRLWRRLPREEDDDSVVIVEDVDETDSRCDARRGVVDPLRRSLPARGDLERDSQEDVVLSR